jgi:hypothetical protein
MGRRWARRRRRLVQRMAAAGPVGGVLAALLSLNKARNYDCEDAFRDTALAVVCHARRGPGERANAQLKYRRIVHKLRHNSALERITRDLRCRQGVDRPTLSRGHVGYVRAASLPFLKGTFEASPFCDQGDIEST